MSVDIVGDVSMNGYVDISENLQVGGRVDIGGDVSMNGDVNISGNLDVSGIILKNSEGTLDISGVDISGNSELFISLNGQKYKIAIDLIFNI